MGSYDRQIYLPASLETGYGANVDINFSRLADLGYNVKAYGAVGDGTTDDTTPIQNAINAANTAGGGTVIFPAASYKITAALTVPLGVRLVGAGSNKSQLLQATAGVPIVQGTGSNCHS